jgi:hypothetical protein
VEGGEQIRDGLLGIHLHQRSQHESAQMGALVGEQRFQRGDHSRIAQSSQIYTHQLIAVPYNDHFFVLRPGSIGGQIVFQGEGVGQFLETYAK